ncbi:hypothetical protein [Flavobacterium marginilacus]|uniref:hypothetical protein n=1 Tax=Flavobacterium marginilacus TaxID=3003256 RepID=UPI00248DF9EF|nr:hypothetical protein [Flavobacterium marginilacus]
MPISVVKEMLGHQSIRQTESYAITTEQTIDREMNNLSSKLGKVNPTIADEALSMISKLEKELQKLKKQFGIE